MLRDGKGDVSNGRFYKLNSYKITDRSNEASQNDLQWVRNYKKEKKKPWTNDDVGQKSHWKINYLQLSKCSEDDFSKKLFMEYLESEEPLDRDETDGGSLTNDSEKANSGTSSIPLLPPEMVFKWDEQAGDWGEVTDRMCFCEVSCHKAQTDFVQGTTCIVMLKPFSAICKGVLEDGRSVVKLEMSKSHYNFPKSRNMQIGSKIGQLIPEMADWKIGEAKHFSVVCQCRLWQRVMSIKSLFPGEKVNIAKCFGFCDCCYVTVSEFSHHDTLLGNGGNIQSYP